MMRSRGVSIAVLTLVILTLVGLTLAQTPAGAAAPAQPPASPTQSTTAPAQPQVAPTPSTTTASTTAAPAQVAPAQLTVVPASGVSGTLVTISSDLAPTATTCTLEQDGTVRQTFPCGPKSTIQYTVIGAPGRHTLALCAPACVRVAAAPSAAAVFVVLAVVPRLIGRAESALPRVLAAAGLKLGTVTGPPGSLVTSQYPPSGSLVNPDEPVDVGLGPIVTISPPTRGNVRLVEVPDVRGDSLDIARAALTGVGLAMSTRSTSGTVATQSPRPGRRVAVGTAVTVTIELSAATASSADTPRPGWYWAIAVAVLVLLALAGGIIARRLRHRRPRTRPADGPPPRVTCRTTVDVAHTRPTRPAAPTIDLRVREHSSLTMERNP